MLMRSSHPVLQFTHVLPYGAVVHDQGRFRHVFESGRVEREDIGSLHGFTGNERRRG